MTYVSKTVKCQNISNRRIEVGIFNGVTNDMLLTYLQYIGGVKYFEPCNKTHA